MKVFTELFIANKGILYRPLLEGEIRLTQPRFGTPAKLLFSVVNDRKIDYQEGNSVILRVNGVNLFYGFVFTKKRNKEQIIETTCYDQMRYLKNKESYVFKKITANEIIARLAADFQLQVGELEDTKHVIPQRVEDGKSLLDIISHAVDVSIANTGILYAFYDDFGKMTLKNIEHMRTEYFVDATQMEDYDYETSIDEETYNKIKLVYDNKEEKKREVFLAQDGGNIGKWGVLQHYEKISTKEQAKKKADALLALHNQKSRTLILKNCRGDASVRGGSLIYVYLPDLGDISLRSTIMVEEAEHRFSESEHLMDLIVRNKEVRG